MNTDTAWELWGARDPYYGVLTDPKFRSEALTPQAREEFFASGRLHVDYVLNICRGHLDASFSPQRVLEFGCGVGRLVIPFANIAKEVVGVDVAQSMLAEARRNCDERGINNISLVPSDDVLSEVEGAFDLVHSCIVLQHITVQRGRGLFAMLVERVAPGGCGAIHVTFAWDIYAETFGRQSEPTAPAPPGALSKARAIVRQSLEPLGLLPRKSTVEPDPKLSNSDPEMQMNFYNLSELMFIMQRAGVQRVHTELTDHGGALGAFLFFQKPAAS